MAAVITISIILTIIAAISNSIMDTVAYQSKWEQSKFSRIKNIFFYRWFKYDSWKLKYKNYNLDIARNITPARKTIGKTKIKIPVQLTDAFHFFKMIMIISLVGSGLIWILYNNISAATLFYVWGGIGVIYNLTFNLFYNKILKSKK